MKLRTETKEQTRKVPVQEAIVVIACLVNGLLAEAKKNADNVASGG